MEQLFAATDERKGNGKERMEQLFGRQEERKEQQAEKKGGNGALAFTGFLPLGRQS